MPQIEYHGHTAKKKQSSEYQIWSQMKMRCFNRKHPKWESYGGRGIGMDPVWVKSFATFLADVGPRPSLGHQIDRIDNDKGYFPGNVKWSTRKEQLRNTRNSKRLFYKGRWWVLVELGEATGVGWKVIQKRLAAGYSVKAAVEQPVEGGSVYIEYKGEKHCLKVWAKRLNISYFTLHSRINRLGWSVEKAFTKQSQGGHS